MKKIYYAVYRGDIQQRGKALNIPLEYNFPYEVLGADAANEIVSISVNGKPLEFPSKGLDYYKPYDENYFAVDFKEVASNSMNISQRQ